MSRRPWMAAGVALAVCLLVGGWWAWPGESASPAPPADPVPVAQPEPPPQPAVELPAPEVAEVDTEPPEEPAPAPEVPAPQVLPRRVVAASVSCAPPVALDGPVAEVLGEAPPGQTVTARVAGEALVLDLGVAAPGAALLLPSSSWEPTAPVWEIRWGALAEGETGRCEASPVGIGMLRLHPDEDVSLLDGPRIEGCATPGFTERPVALDGLEVRYPFAVPCEMRLVGEVEGLLVQGDWVKVEPIAGEWVDVDLPLPAPETDREMDDPELDALEALVAQKQEHVDALLRVKGDLERTLAGEQVEGVYFAAEPAEMMAQLPAMLSQAEAELAEAEVRCEAAVQAAH